MKGEIQEGESIIYTGLGYKNLNLTKHKLYRSLYFISSEQTSVWVINDIGESIPVSRFLFISKYEDRERKLKTFLNN